MGYYNAAMLLAVFGALLMAKESMAIIDMDKPTQSAEAANTWIVQLKQAPVVNYKGGIPGVAATQPAPGTKINPASTNVVRTVAYLKQTGIDAVKRAGGDAAVAKIKAHYTYAYAGFAISNPTSAELEKLRQDPSVLAVTKSVILKPATFTTPHFLGLDTNNGAWSKLGGVGAAGENVIVGIIDTGIWPENPSFSDRKGLVSSGAVDYQPLPPGAWYGGCSSGESFDPSKHCNLKLIGCKYFSAGILEAIAPQNFKDALPGEYLSCRGAESHGSHTASTAAGANGAPVSIPGFGFTGKLSGMAPRARIAMYKVCWGDYGCTYVDIMAAIDQAVADGVNIINYSIGGPGGFLGPDQNAFMSAAAAGIFVAASAGNSGPSSGTVANLAPWVTTVAASTHDRGAAASVTLGNGKVYNGAPSSQNMQLAFGPAPLVLGNNAVASGKSSQDAQLCIDGALDPAKVANKIVVCDRGVNARVEKSLAVAAAGGIGMILLNTPDLLDILVDPHVIPTVHLPATNRNAVRAYAAAATATAKFSAAKLTTTMVAPKMADFSSRGPCPDGNGDLLKPDITAPGVDIVAAVTPAQYGGANYGSLSGTSMSSPHIAGIAALLKQKYPKWSPMAIKSAIMTTAYRKTISGTPLGQAFGMPFDYGAGHVDPTAALNPGLVFDSGVNDWKLFLCGVGSVPKTFCPDCTGNGASLCNPQNLNYPSVAFGKLKGQKTFKRVLTNVLSVTATFKPTISLPSGGGFTLTLSPSTFTLNAGASQDVKITIKSDKKVFNSYVDGSITWKSDKGTSTRIPVVARPIK